MLIGMRQHTKIWVKRFVLLAIRLLFQIRKAGAIDPFSAEDIHSILLVETAFLGDVVALTPSIKVLRAKFPGIRLDVLVDRNNAPLLQCEKRIDTLWTVDTRRCIALLKIILAMRRSAYDLVVCASPGVRNSLLTLLAGGHYVSGYLLHHFWNTSFFNDFYAVSIGSDTTGFYPRQAHLTRRALNALAPLNLGIDATNPDIVPFLRLCPKIEEEKSSMLHADGFINPKKINLVIHPCASWAYKQWPLESMALLIQQLFSRYPDQLHVVLIGLAAEKVVLEAIEQNVSQPIMLLLGTDLLTVMTLIKQANLFLGNDSGPKHIADAFKKPLVELLGPGLPETVGGKNRQVHSVYAGAPCSPCSQMQCHTNGLCMRNIRIEAVLSPLCLIIEGQLDNISNKVTS